MKNIIFTLLLLTFTSVKAQKVHSVQYANQADIKVYVTEYENQADLKIFFVKYENQAGWREKKKMHLMF